MKCKYYDDCPSASGWCLYKQPTVECIGFVETSIDNQMAQLKKSMRVWNHIKDVGGREVER